MDLLSFPLINRSQPPARNSLLSPFPQPDNQLGSSKTYSLAHSHTSVCCHAATVFALVWHLGSRWRQELYCNRNFTNMVKKINNSFSSLNPNLLVHCKLDICLPWLIRMTASFAGFPLGKFIVRFKYEVNGPL